MNRQRHHKQPTPTKKNRSQTLPLGPLYRWAITLCTLGLLAAAVLKYTGVFERPRYLDTMEASEFTEQELRSLLNQEDAVLCYRPEPENLQELEAGCSYVDNMVLVYMEPDATQEEKLNVIQAADGELAGLDNVSGCLQIRVSPGSPEELTSLCQELSEEDSVWNASFDIAMPVIPEASVPDDPFEEWGGCSWDGKMDENNWAWEAIDAPKAWGLADELSEVTVGVVDGGFWGVTRHEDMEVDYTYYNPSEDSMPLVNGKVFEGFNLVGLHGLEVSSVLAAQADNGKGTAGIGRNISRLYFTNFLPNDLEYVGEDEPGSDFFKNVHYTWLGRIEACVSKLLAPETDPIAIFFGNSEEKVQKTKLINLSQGYHGELGPLTQELIDLYGSRLSGYLYQVLLRGQEKDSSFDFLIVQSAGNGLDNRMTAPLDAAGNGLFASVTEENCCSPSPKTGYSKEDILDRIVIAGAVARRENEDGSFRIVAEPGSNYGATVDILAPGRDVLCAKMEVHPQNVNTIRSAYALLNGTSFSAPFVTGTAAMVWGANPALTGPQVKAILKDSAQLTFSAPDYQGMFRDESGNLYEYPVLNAGSAVEMAIASRDWPPEIETLPPVIETLPPVIETLPPKTEEETLPPEELLTPGELLAKELSRLAEQYGVIALGEETYPEITGYGGGEELVAPGRLTGLLGADICDYDGDGQEELFTLRLETGAPPSDGWGETRCVLTIYEWDSGAGQAFLADEQSFRINALTNSLTNSALHLARKPVEGGGNALYLTYEWDMNDCTFGVLRINYDGILKVNGGVECHEYHGAFQCYDAVGNGAIDTLFQSGYADSDGWTLLNSDSFEGSEVPEESRVYDYRACYMEQLEEIGLIEPGLPGMWMNPDRPQGNDREAAQLQAQFDRASIVRKPADRYIVSNGQLTTLCGLWHLGSNALLNADMTLSLYDETGLLSPWR